MGSILVRFIVIVLALVGVYKMFPQVSKPVDYYIKNPKFTSSVVKPAINVANGVLPDKLQIPTPPEVMGSTIDASMSSPIEELSAEISRQAAELAGEQINQIKKSATDTFCKVLVEKIQSECGISAVSGSQ